METKNMVGMILAIAVGVICIGTVMMPTLTDVRQTIGDEVTYYNGGNSPLLMDYYDDDFTMTYDGADTVTIGDHSVTRDSTLDYRLMYWEYGRIVMGHGTSNIQIFDYRTGSSATTINYAATLSYDASENTITVTKDSDSSTVATITADTVMAVKENGAYVFVASAGIGSAYYNMEAANNGTLGFLDTSKTYGEYTLEIVANKNGISVYGLPDGTEYTATLEVVGGALVDGTTDVYQNGTPTFTITIGEDVLTVSSYRFGQAILYEISGHESSGASYDLIGIIPIMTVLALLMVAVRFVTRRD